MGLRRDIHQIALLLLTNAMLGLYL
ncbi:Protein of unknown function [Pyronema omphalodes CBS 100304]|uniref:Uncharacterized protein n=1 Tax=Pyronema omphalodes (strain CBS 100304) TaxID=1076935 RepID=U4KUJ7_PYROM|nr:Protein of unknown function [Pyronema omphalodes CBS 100304]